MQLTPQPEPAGAPALFAESLHFDHILLFFHYKHLCESLVYIGDGKLLLIETNALFIFGGYKMLYGNLRDFADAIISRDKYKATGQLRELADAIISGDKYKAPSGHLRDLADAIINRDKYKVASGPLRDFADALISGDKYRASGDLRNLADAIISGDKYKVGGGGGCYIATATMVCKEKHYVLVNLRQWRNEIMRPKKIGRTLEAYYDKIGPSVAEKAANDKWLAASLFYLFVKPAVWLVSHKKNSSFSGRIYDAGIYALFIAGLVNGSIVYMFSSRVSN